MITGIVVALPEELATLTQLTGFNGGQKIAKGSCAFLASNLAIVYSGTGPQNAKLGAELLLANGVTRLISWGCAAALNETLKAGDLLLADSLIDSGHHKVTIQREWVRHAVKQLLQYLPVHNGCLTESEHIVSFSKDKKRLNLLTEAIALDMESVAIAKVAELNNLPFLCIRAIADPVEMDLPRSVHFALNNQGDIVMSKLLYYLVCHPTELSGLIKLGLYFNSAKSTLKLVAKHLNKILDPMDNSNQQHV